MTVTSMGTGTRHRGDRQYRQLAQLQDWRGLPLSLARVAGKRGGEPTTKERSDGGSWDFPDADLLLRSFASADRES